MNAIDLLKLDHDAVDLLFSRCENTPPSKHEATVRRIKAELDAHAHIEEKIFYPACRQRGRKELHDIIAEALEEHAQMKKFLQEISRSTSTEKREAKLKVLIEDTRHHVKEEEDEMFPLVEDEFSSEELEAMGERMEAEKKKFQKRKRITPRRAQPPKGIVATVMGKAMGLIEAVTGVDTAEGSKRSPAKRGAKKTTAQSRGNGNGKAKSKGRGNGGRAATKTDRPAKKASGAKGRSSKSSGRASTGR